MDYMEKARALRASEDRHYNCFQSVLLPFAGELGLAEERAYALGAHFGGGMRHGSACGALSGALMVLGGLDFGEEEARAFLERFTRDHGSTACAALLQPFQGEGTDHKPFCDGLVYEMVAALAELDSRHT